jgi:lipopolysaccharide/colanic/teichoic acid biosynthesis glycosyltransferase
MTGLWQISGRSTRGTLEMLRLDDTYVKACGFWRDVIILLLTVRSLLHGDGAR